MRQGAECVDPQAWAARGGCRIFLGGFSSLITTGAPERGFHLRCEHVDVSSSGNITSSRAHDDTADVTERRRCNIHAQGPVNASWPALQARFAKRDAGPWGGGPEGRLVR